MNKTEITVQWKDTGFSHKMFAKVRHLRTTKKRMTQECVRDARRGTKREMYHGAQI